MPRVEIKDDEVVIDFRARDWDSAGIVLPELRDGPLPGYKLVSVYCAPHSIPGKGGRRCNVRVKYVPLRWGMDPIGDDQAKRWLAPILVSARGQRSLPPIDVQRNPTPTDEISS